MPPKNFVNWISVPAKTSFWGVSKESSGYHVCDLITHFGMNTGDKTLYFMGSMGAALFLTYL
jgi:hypothetical protein